MFGGYRGLTRDSYALDLRQFLAFGGRRQLKLFEVRGSDIERCGRELEANGRATATIVRRLCTVTSFYRCAVEEGLIAHSPAVHVRCPRVDYESHAVGLDRNEVGALLVAAGLGPSSEDIGPSRCCARAAGPSNSPGATHRTRRRPGHR